MKFTSNEEQNFTLINILKWDLCHKMKRLGNVKNPKNVEIYIKVVEIISHYNKN